MASSTVPNIVLIVGDTSQYRNATPGEEFTGYS